MEKKRGNALFTGRRLLFKNVRGVALLAAVLAAVQAAALHFDVARQLVGRDLRLSGITRLNVDRSRTLADFIQQHGAHRTSLEWRHTYSV